MMRFRVLVCIFAGLCFAGVRGAEATGGITEWSSSPDSMRVKASAPIGDSEHRSVTTFGIGYGSSLLGFDHEIPLASHLGLRFGAGLLGADAGLLLHVANHVRSSGLAIAIEHLGGPTESSNAGTILGGSVVFRDRGRWTFELGYGRVLQSGRSSVLRTGEGIVLARLGMVLGAR